MGGLLGYAVGIIGLVVSLIMAMGTDKNPIQAIQGVAAMVFAIAVVLMTSQYLLGKRLNDLGSHLRSIIDLLERNIERTVETTRRGVIFDLGDWVVADSSPRKVAETDEEFIVRRYIQKVASGYQVGSTLHSNYDEAVKSVMYRFKYVNNL
jgi:hypothetical protein